MVDYINYYYDLYPNKINEIDNKYFFSLNSDRYVLITYTRNLNELKDIVTLNKFMIDSGSLVHEIISNKSGDYIININNNNYMLMRFYVDINIKVNLNDILMFSNNRYLGDNLNSLYRFEWDRLWEHKVDNIEYEIMHIIKKYPYLNSIIDYYIGLSENAIMYYKHVNKVGLQLSISHKRLNYDYTLFDFYNPLNLIIDFNIRDICEYIKSLYFNSYYRENIFKIFSTIYFDNNTISLLISRLLFPTYFFDCFDNILENSLNENSIFNIIKKSSSYENFIYSIISRYNVLYINWLH